MAAVIDTILIEDVVGEVRAALLSGGAVVEVQYRRPDDRVIPGAVFRGRVRKIDKGLNAAFVDIGEARDAFLRARDARGGTRSPRVERLIAEGATIVVSVVAAPADGKGARVAMADGAPGEGVGLMEPAPGLAAEVLARFLDDQVVTVGVDGAAALADVRAAVATRPGFAGTVDLVSRPGSLFEAHGVEAALAEARQRQVAVPGGGQVTFDATEALHVIDVDSSGRAGRAGRGALDLNMAAMLVVARQVRLRGLAGALVVDAVRMARGADRDAVVAALRAAFAGDPGAPTVHGVSALGLIEVSRQRSGASLSAYLGGGDEVSPETAAYMALRAVLRAFQPQLGARWRLACAVPVAALLDGKLAAQRAATAAALGADLQVVGDDGRGTESWDVGPL